MSGWNTGSKWAKYSQIGDILWLFDEILPTRTRNCGDGGFEIVFSVVVSVTFDAVWFADNCFFDPQVMHTYFAPWPSIPPTTEQNQCILQLQNLHL